MSSHQRRVTHRRSGFDNRDMNEGPLLTAARQLGGWWTPNHGPLDGSIFAQTGRFPGQHVPVEIKNPDAPNPRDTQNQKDWFTEADRRGAPYYRWRTVDDVIADLSGRPKPLAG